MTRAAQGHLLGVTAPLPASPAERLSQRPPIPGRGRALTCRPTPPVGPTNHQHLPQTSVTGPKRLGVVIWRGPQGG